MRTDKLSHLKQRLRKGADSFDFNALIQGVSTMEEDTPQDAENETNSESLLVSEPQKNPQENPGDLQIADKETISTPPPSFSYGENHVLQAVPALPSKASVEPVAPPILNIPDGNPIGGGTPHIQDERLITALDSLVKRLRTEIVSFQTLLDAGDSDQAGFSLVRINHVLDLLNSLDPEGSISRTLKIASSPPQDCTWPQSVWSVMELAESPLSGLLPPHADDQFIRAILTAAWDSAPN